MFRYRINDPIRHKNLLIILPTSEDFLQPDRSMDSPFSKEKEGNLAVICIEENIQIVAFYCKRYKNILRKTLFAGMEGQEVNSTGFLKGQGFRLFALRFAWLAD